MKSLLTLMTMVLMISLLAFSASAQDADQPDPQGNQEQQEPQGVHLLGPAPNAGDGIPDGSGWDVEHGAPNSGDGIPDGSGWDKAFIDEDGDGIADQNVHTRTMTGDARSGIRGANAQGTSTGEASGTMNENFYSGLDPRAVDGGNGPFSDADGFGPAGDGVSGAASGEPAMSGTMAGQGQGGKK